MNGVSTQNDLGAPSAGATEFELRKLRWRCRRGMKELDVLLERYLDERFREAPREEQMAFCELLEYQDPQVWRFCIGQERPESPVLARFVDRLTGIDEPGTGRR